MREVSMAVREAPAPIGRRLEIAAGLPIGTELVVCLALLRVLEDLVGLFHLLEARLGVRLLADIGMIFSGQLAIGPLDLIGSRVASNAE